MKATILLLVAICACAGTVTVWADTDAIPITIKMLVVYGAETADSADVLSEFSRIDTPRTRQHLSEFSVFAVRKGHDASHPNGEFGSLLVSENNIPTYFDSMSEAATFLSERIEEVALKQEAASLMLLLTELFSYKIVTEPPPDDTGTRTKRQTESDWMKKFETLEAGWSLGCTLLFDPNIALCKRVTIFVTKDGTLTVSEPKRVFSRGGYL